MLLVNLEELHNKCNINVRLPRKLTIIFTIIFTIFTIIILLYLQGYDGHIIFKEWNKFNVDIDVIPKGIDKYMSIIVNRHITFIDSLQFYNGSLDTLASNLKDEDFKHLTSEFGIDKLEILKRKEACPYEWLDSNEKFSYKQLPPKECFYSSLGDEIDGYISDEQYLHLKNIAKYLILILLKIFTIII